ncbi:hypothetical protein OG2516_08212 [Oceanicola granulosus HTCC2516]|uniref:Uncharacterized protein n=1 Tax=Oceanicola granulosus (strain ATCC BAA-861 / DSM 15982 / KCTC 12143 / HTCC2516) TaxID=314256 RepID=Q2CI12_OCEGH|nr:hypothetical protein [Oceanicola granulosus]EAR52446.1 hypothetical protein OG2516_08212 [Oceanicola granulosus HTCC2516]
MRIIISALLAGLVAGPVAADHLTQIAGQYLCKHAMDPLSGLADDKHYWEYQLTANADGTFGMQGYYFNFALGQIGIQGGGQYDLAPDIEPDAVRFRGQLTRANGMQEPYQMTVRRLDGRQMYVQVRTQTHMVNITCER